MGEIYNHVLDRETAVYSPKSWIYFICKSLPDDLIFRDELCGGDPDSAYLL